MEWAHPKTVCTLCHALRSADTAINGKSYAGDIARILARQKRDGARYFLELSEPPHWNALKLSAKFVISLMIGSIHLGKGSARPDRVDPYSFRSERHRQIPSKVADSPLRRVIHVESSAVARSGYRRNIDNRTP